MTPHKLLMELASHIHNTIDNQGITITYGNRIMPCGCYHIGPGLGICEGLARTILQQYEVTKK